jgi:hypothetical protein
LRSREHSDYDHATRNEVQRPKTVERDRSKRVDAHGASMDEWIARRGSMPVRRK